jgi:3-hydroxyacyl-CoA dehydrogenase
MGQATTAVLGCGVIGSSWVTAFHTAGHKVRVWDPDPAAAARAVRGLDAVTLCDTPEQAAEGADFVQENGPENLAAKRDLCSRIGRVLDAEAVIASSTSTLLASDIQSGLDCAERIIVGHPFNPPHVIPLVEVVGGAASAEWAIDKAMRFYAALGKHPIRLRVERPGHLANRLQAALWREAVDAVACGQASVADVDAAVTLALGPRWALTGPFATFAIGGGEGGLAHFLEHLGAPFEALWDDARRPAMTAALTQTLVEGVARELDGAPLIHGRQEREERLRRIIAIGRRGQLPQ